jgi:hypothetical protein
MNTRQNDANLCKFTDSKSHLKFSQTFVWLGNNFNFIWIEILFGFKNLQVLTVFFLQIYISVCSYRPHRDLIFAGSFFLGTLGKINNSKTCYR